MDDKYKGIQKEEFTIGAATISDFKMSASPVLFDIKYTDRLLWKYV